LVTDARSVSVTRLPLQVLGFQEFKEAAKERLRVFFVALTAHFDHRGMQGTPSTLSTPAQPGEKILLP
jgi:hypothetical protein